MNAKQLERGKEIEERISYLQSFVDGKESYDFEHRAKNYDFYRNDAKNKWTSSLKNDSLKDKEMIEFFKDELEYAIDKVLHRMQKEIGALTKEFNNL